MSHGWGDWGVATVVKGWTGTGKEQGYVLCSHG